MAYHLEAMGCSFGSGGNSTSLGNGEFEFVVAELLAGIGLEFIEAGILAGKGDVVRCWSLVWISVAVAGMSAVGS